MSRTIDTARGIAEYFQVSLRHIRKLLPEMKASNIILTRTVKKICRDGKMRFFKVKYSTPFLLDRWEFRRGGLFIKKNKLNNFDEK